MKKKKKKFKHRPYRNVFIGISLSLLVAVFGLFISGQSNSQFCANSISCIKDLSGLYQQAKGGTFLGRNVSVPSSQKLAMNEPETLGENTGSNKHIYINLSTQRLSAYEDHQLIYDFPVSTGKWYFTPTGDFQIWIKLRYTLMAGGNQAAGTYYYLPNVPYTMYFYNDEHPKTQGFGIHGAYWHNNFGHPMSHGCVNMREEDVAKLFYWANPPTGSGDHTVYASADNPGTPITIYGETPIE